MVFLFIQAEKSADPSDQDHEVLSHPLFFIEEALLQHGANWTRRKQQKVLSIFPETGDPVGAALAIQQEFQNREWEGLGKVRVKAVFHSGEAEVFGQDQVGPDVTHALKLLDAAWSGQVLFSLSAVHFVPVPPGGKLEDLGEHVLKDLAPAQNVFLLRFGAVSHDAFPPLRSLKSFPQNLPEQSSPFLGREEEIGELSTLLCDAKTRLVTLRGPGGFGKTRLAYQAASEVVDRFQHGVFSIPLAPLLSDQLIVGSIASAVKYFFSGPLDVKTQLLNHLKYKKMLLVMDNFEHIIEGAELVNQILDAAPGVKILATSRESLRLDEETVFEVRGLRYPPEDRAEDAEAFSAVQLFLRSVHRLKPGFAPSEIEMKSILRICRLLEGMPLGLELSAAWAGTLSLEEIGDKIETSRDFLATSMPHLPPRHRSLRAVFEYSWILLSEGQKRSLRILSVFKGGFSLDAAKKVASAAQKVLSELEHKSLIRKRGDGRYDLHELLRFYAKEKLFDDPKAKEKAQDAHCAYFSKLLFQRARHLTGAGRYKALSELSGEMDNLREGWKRAVENADPKEMNEYMEGLFWIYDIKGWYQEARDNFETAAQVLWEKYPHDHQRPRTWTLILARLLGRWGFFENNLGRPKNAQSLLEESLSMYQKVKATAKAGLTYSALGMVTETIGNYEGSKNYYEKAFRSYLKDRDAWGQNWALNHLGHIHIRIGDGRRAEGFIQKGLALSRKDKDPRALAYSYNLLGDIRRGVGRLEEAKGYFQKGLSAYLESGDRRGLAWSFTNLGMTTEALGDYNGARQMYREGLAIFRDLGDQRSVAWCQNLLGQVSWSLGEYEEAARLYADGSRLYQEVGDPRGVAWSLDLTGNVQLANGDIKAAEESYRKAFGLLEKEGLNSQDRAWSAYHWAMVFYARNQMRESKEQLQKALELFRKLKDPLGQGLSLIHLAEEACVRRDFAATESFLQKALSITLDHRLIPLAVDALITVARLLKSQGRDHKAMGFLMAALAHPTCGQQTKDRAVSLMLDLNSHFSEEEVADISRWSRTVTLESLVMDWLSPQKATAPKRIPSKTKRR